VVDAGRLLREALETYAGAMERLALVQRAWENADRPIVVRHGNGTVGMAPLWKALHEQETHVDRLRRPLLRRGHAGAQSFLDRAADEGRIGDDLSPAARLRLIRPPASAELRKRVNAPKPG
jgi:hypothetical protein